MLNNIPGELRSLAQWVIADMTVDPATGQPKKHPLNPRTGQLADVTDPGTWGTFEEAIRTGCKHVGFVLSPSDPYTIIDLDNKPHKPASPDQLARHYKILEAFNSYTERSTSGTGYHIIIRGNVPVGVHRDNVEVYSAGRYMICTGDVVRPSPITDYQSLLDVLFAEMQPPPVAELVDRESVLDDMDLLEMASNAVNGDKFNQLCRGDWQNEYPSQSEADFALLSIIAFYTPDNEQVRRIFRMSALGKRDKATRDNKYLDRALQKIRGQQPAPIDFSMLIKNAAAITEQVDTFTGEIKVVPVAPANVSYMPGAEPKQLSNIELPPGLIGDLAQYFYASAVRPVPEVALAAAIAIVAGVAGRSYNISGSGLNQYLILLAKTGSGKEGALTGIENLLAAIRPQVPMADQFLGPAAFASGQALVKVLNERPCFVSVLGEFGLTLQQLSDHRANSAQLMLRKVLLDLYAKSGWNRTLRSSVYSDVEKNTKVIQAPNVTILGESTPETFFDGLDASHIAEGLIPRFSVIQYDGDRPARNRNANTPPSLDLAQRFSDLIAVALTTTNNNTCCPVQIDAQALRLLDDFDAEADAIMNESKHEVETQLWNRAHLKALKLAALLAVGVNPHQPVVTAVTASWAIEFVRRDVSGVSQRFLAGDVGQGDGKQQHDLKRAIEMYFKAPPRYMQHDPEMMKLHAAKLIPARYLQQRLASVASYRNDRSGSRLALQRAIVEMIEAGLIVEIPQGDLFKNFGFRGKAFGIVGHWS